MEFNNSDFGTARELTDYARTILENVRSAQDAAGQFTLANVLPDNTVDDIDYETIVGGNQLGTTAEYRAYDAESPIMEDEGQIVMRGQLPPISIKIPSGEYKQLKQRDQVVVGQMDDAAKLAKAIVNRAEFARAQVLEEGKITLRENGLFLDVDYGRKAEHTQTAANLWSTAEADPFADLVNWMNVYSQTNGVYAGEVLVSQKVLNTLLANEKFATAVYGANAGRSYVAIADMQSYLAAHGLPNIRVYGANAPVAGNLRKSFLSENKITFVPGDNGFVGQTLWGTTAEARQPKYNIDRTEQPGIVVGSYIKEDPLTLWTKASAIMLPVVSNPNATFTATVL